MRHKGSSGYYADERNAELMAAYRDVIWNNAGTPLMGCMQLIVNRPTSRFFVTEERAGVVLSDMLRGREISNLSPSKMEMYTEILRRVKALMAVRPGALLKDIIHDVIRMPAPKFYLTPQSAAVIIHRIKHKLIMKK